MAEVITPGSEPVPSRDEIYRETIKYISNAVKGYEIMNVRQEGYSLVVACVKAGLVIQLRIGMEGERKQVVLEALN